MVLETNWPELFEGNPNVDLAVRSKIAPRYRKPRYRIGKETRTHILDQLAESVGLPRSADRRVEMFLTPGEVHAVTRDLPQRYVVVCPVGKRTVAANRKDWGMERFQAVVDRCSATAFVQIGTPGDPLLRGVIDRRGLPIRASAAVLAGARRALVLEGGLMHLARAVGTHAVVIYGGAVAPEVSAYPEHTNLVVRAPCGPCFRSHGRLEDCPTMDCT
ncbi:glycosyltransferase family 9 protein [Deferrisoma sp.]